MVYYLNKAVIWIVHYRNVIPTSGSCGATSSTVEYLGSNSSLPVSTSTAGLPVMTSILSSDADGAHCSRLLRTDMVPHMLAAGEIISSTGLINPAKPNHPSYSEVIGNRNKNDRQRTSKQFSPKTRIRRTQLKMLADNLSEFYAPAAGGKRRELLAQRRSAAVTERSARERQLEVIQKQVSLVEKRKKAELEMAATASRSDASDPDSSCVHTADRESASNVSKQMSATARFKARLNRKLHTWKTKQGKIAVQRKQKLLCTSREHCEEDGSSSAKSMLFLLLTFE